MAHQQETSSEFYRVSPRSAHTGTNRMGASTIAVLSASASMEYWMFPLPPKCIVVGGAITASGIGASENVGGVFKVGTAENDSAFGTYTVSGTAVLAQRLNIYAPITVSTSDDVVPYQRPVIITNLSITSSTNSFSFYLMLEYVMPGNLP